MIATRTEEDRVTMRTVILDETVFKREITRERKRTERSGMAMVLLLMNVSSSLREPLASCAAVTEALSGVESDLVLFGWFELRKTMGMIVPDIDPADLTVTCDRLERAVLSAIMLQGDEELVQHLSIRLLVYPEPATSDEKQVSPMETLFYPELLGNVPVVSNFQTLKRGMDIVLSALLLILLLPAFAFVAVLVKLSSSGPVFFKQTRVGHLMRPFTMYKFRSMYAKADHRAHHDYVSWFITASDQPQSQQKPSVFKLTNDTRITPIGQILRRTSLDELPQLWNVLIGDMSLVGPRPPLPYELNQYKPWHRGRVLQAKPGVTGLWQVVGRSRTTFDEMVRLDLRYARTMCLWSDIKILLATPRAMVSGKGAH